MADKERKLKWLLWADSEMFKRGLNQAKGQLSGFDGAVRSTFKNLAVSVGAAFSVAAIGNFTKEIAQIAAQSEGITAAFRRIADSADLTNFRNSVKGTVSDLDLMKRAVMADALGLPVEQLGKLFEFAAVRAQETGESVDYLVDSIVRGIGRKSTLILDNLGISALSLKEAMGGITVESASVADFTRGVSIIADEAIAKSGGLAETTASKIQRLGAQWDNVKRSLGNVIVESGILQGSLDLLSSVIGKNSSTIEEERATVNQLVLSITGYNEGNEKRVQGINRLKTAYPDFFGKLDIEKSTNEEILSVLKKVNEEYSKRAVMEQYSKDLAGVVKEEQDLEKQRVRSIRQLQQFSASYNIQYTTLEDLISKTKEFVSYQRSGTAESNVAKGFTAGLENAYNFLDGYDEKAKEIASDKAGLNEAIKGVIDMLNFKDDGSGLAGSMGAAGGASDKLSKELEKQRKKWNELTASIEDYKYEALNSIKGTSETFVDTFFEKDRDMILAKTWANKLEPEAEVEVDLKAADDATDKLKEKASEIRSINQSISASFADLGVSIAESLGNAIASGGNVFDSLGQMLLSSLADLAISVGKIAIATGAAVEAVRDTLLNIFGGGVGAIAAGAALVAIGTAVKGAMAGAISGRGSYSASSGTYDTRKFSAGQQTYGLNASAMKVQIVGETRIQNKDIYIAYKNAETNRKLNT